MPSSYKEATYHEITRWQADTEIEYVPNGKRAGTKSSERYDAYAVAKTVADALRLGSKPEDLLNDFEKGLLKRTGGPMREAPLDLMEIQDASDLTEVDLILARWGYHVDSEAGANPQETENWKAKAAEQYKNLRKIVLAKKHGLRPQDIVETKTWAESPDMIARRTKANMEAGKVLGAAKSEERKVSNEEVLSILRMWAFKKNHDRRTVAPAGNDWVLSDVLGLIRTPDNRYMASLPTRSYPQVTQLLCQYLKDSRPDGVEINWPFTSIHVNSSFTAKRHRDVGSTGPCAIKALGDFEGGDLGYWPDDNRSVKVEDLRDSDKVILDPREMTVVIDGCRCHHVESYEGEERFSLVYFISDGYAKTPKDVQDVLEEAGINFPTAEAAESITQLFPAPQGYSHVVASVQGAEESQEKPARERKEKPAREPRTRREAPAVVRSSKTRPEKAPGSLYAESTYKMAFKWTEETRIKYVQGAKREGTASSERYNIYSQARTIGEALELGSKPQDLLHDYERDFLQIHKEQRGTWRTEPLVITMKKDKSKLSVLDNFLIKLKGPVCSNIKMRHAKFLTAMKLSRKMGVDLNSKRNETKNCESADMTAERVVADQVAQKILEAVDASGRRVTDQELLAVLKFWSFARNDSRRNVMPEGKDFVHSDTLGMVVTRVGKIMVARASDNYPHVTKVLSRWLKDRRPKELDSDFPFTSINVNSGYNAKRHRDSNNSGPSMIKAFGKYEGGQLGYWPDDDKSCSLDDLRSSDRVSLDLSQGLALFDGNRAHEVDDFSGERFSLVFFTAGQHFRMPPEVRKRLTELGITMPTKTKNPEEALGCVQSLLPPPRGYHGKCLSDMFGHKSANGEPAKVYQWLDTHRDEEEAEAEALISNLTRDPPEKTKRPERPVDPSQHKLMDVINPAGSSKGEAATPVKQRSGDLGEARSSMKRRAVQNRLGILPSKRAKLASPNATAEQGLELLQEGLATLREAATKMQGGDVALAAELRPQLMQHMQEVLVLAASA